MSTPDLTMVSEADWNEARRRLPVIRRLAENRTRTRADVVAGAAELGFGATQIYAFLRAYLDDPRLTTLLPAGCGPPWGYSKLKAEVNAVIEEAIDAVYLTRQRLKIVDLVAEVHRQCVARGLAKPGRKAVTARVRKRPAREIVAKREGRKAARDRFARSPLAAVADPDRPYAGRCDCG
jgi:putative transposase